MYVGYQENKVVKTKQSGSHKQPGRVDNWLSKTNTTSMTVVAAQLVYRQAGRQADQHLEEELP